MRQLHNIWRANSHLGMIYCRMQRSSTWALSKARAPSQWSTSSTGFPMYAQMWTQFKKNSWNCRWMNFQRRSRRRPMLAPSGTWHSNSDHTGTWTEFMSSMGRDTVSAICVLKSSCQWWQPQPVLQPKFHQRTNQESKVNNVKFIKILGNGMALQWWKKWWCSIQINELFSSLFCFFSDNYECALGDMSLNLLYKCDVGMNGYQTCKFSVIKMKYPMRTFWSVSALWKINWIPHTYLMALVAECGHHSTGGYYFARMSQRQCVPKKLGIFPARGTDFAELISCTDINLRLWNNVITVMRTASMISHG